MTIGIHQPNYLPWIGYFNKMKQCDKFVIFDDVQLPTGKNFETRSTIKTTNGPFVLTIPIKDRNNDLLIKDAIIDDNNWRDRHFKTIKFNYAKAPYFNKYIGDLEQIYKAEWKSLLALNVMLIKTFAKWLDINCNILLSSELGVTSSGEDKILEIIQNLGGDSYVSGTGVGSRRYIREEDFGQLGLELIWQDFSDPIYPQLHGEFVPKLSMLDLLMNVGDQSNKYF